MYLILAHAPNPDISHDSRAGYWDTPVDDGTPHVAEPTCIDEARLMVERYIARNRLGGGNWYASRVAGFVLRDDGSWSRIAYNGNVLPLEPDDQPRKAQAATLMVEHDAV